MKGKFWSVGTIRTTYYWLSCTECPIKFNTPDFSERTDYVKYCPGVQTLPIDYWGDIPKMACRKCGGIGMINTPKPTNAVWWLLDRITNEPAQFKCGICAGTGIVNAHSRKETPQALLEGWTFVEGDYRYGRKRPAHWTRTNHPKGVVPMVMDSKFVSERPSS